MMHLRNGPFICFKPSIIHSILISQMTGMQVVNGGMGIKNPLLSTREMFPSNHQHLGEIPQYITRLYVSKACALFR